jgi:hypothetical protein
MLNERLRRWLHEPLLHFVVLGALLFLAYRWLGNTEQAPAQIVVSAPTIAGLAQGFARTWQRPPTQSELSALIEEHIKDEIYYREALAAGLDRDDTIVRRRLRQKMEFLQEDVAAQIEPTEAELRAYLERNAERYRAAARVSFTHVYLSPDRRGTRLDADAQHLLARLRDSRESAGLAGDPFPLALEFRDFEADQLDRLFGGGFAEALAAVPPGQWAGPVKSGYGVHLVRVAGYVPPAAAEFAEIREALARDWSAEQRQKLADDFYRELRRRYAVTVEDATEVPVFQAARGNP